VSIEAMKQALDALEGWAGHGKWIYPESALEQAKKNTSEALPVLRAAIQQAEEPRYKLSCGCPSQYGGIPAEWTTTDRDGSPAIAYGVICEKHWHEYDAQHPKVWQEPVAYGVLDDDGQIDWTADYPFSNEPGWPDSVPLYFPPPRREWQGLTDEQIGQIIAQCKITLVNYCSDEKQKEFARAIETKLKEKNTWKVAQAGKTIMLA